MSKRSPPIHLSKTDARLIVLDRQGLLSAGRFKSPLQALEHLGYIQIDTISVIERAHDHVLWTRHVDARRGTLNELVKQKDAFEYWSHAAAYLPMRDYRFSLLRKQASKKKYKDWFNENKKIVKRVRDTIRAEGPKRSSDFEDPKKAGGWWNWKPAKQALDLLWFTGELMVPHREGFQKIYDLTERVLPSGVATLTPTLKEYARYLVDEAIRSHGLFRPSEVAYLRARPIKQEVEKLVKQMLKAGELAVYQVDGVEKPFLGEAGLQVPPRPSRADVHFLSPFDSLVIQRKRLFELFGFDYQIECYVPEPKRKYGYFTLPILHGTEFVGRMDLKAERDEAQLRVKQWWGESLKKPELKKVIQEAEKLEHFLAFNSCKTIKW